MATRVFQNPIILPLSISKLTIAMRLCPIPCLAITSQHTGPFQPSTFPTLIPMIGGLYDMIQPYCIYTPVHSTPQHRYPHPIADIIHASLVTSRRYTGRYSIQHPPLSRAVHSLRTYQLVPLVTLEPAVLGYYMMSPTSTSPVHTTSHTSLSSGPSITQAWQISLLTRPLS